MSFIAEAFALVRPDTTGFAAELKKKLRNDLSTFTPPVIKITAQVRIDPTSVKAMKDRLQTTVVKIPVQPILAPGAARTLRNEILAATTKTPIPINVRVAGIAQVAQQAAAASGPSVITPVSQTAATPRVARTARTSETAAAEASGSAKVTAALNAENAATEKLDRTQASLAALRTRATAASDAAARADIRGIELTEALSAASRARARALTLEDRLLDSQQNTEAARAAALGREIEANVKVLQTRKALVDVDVQLAAVEGAAANATSALAGAQAEKSAAAKAVTASQAALAAAIETTNVQLIAQAEATLQSATALQAEKVSTTETLALKERQVAIDAQLVALQEQLTRANVAGAGDTAAVAARAQFNASKIAAQNAAAIRQQLVEEGALTQVQLVEIDRLTQLGIRQAGVTEARLADTRAAVRQSTVQSQAARGAAATGASFLGLRGAVLSSSGGFLAATIAVTALSKVVGQASQLQQSFNTFQAVTGSTADQMERVSAAAKELGADLSLPATSANDAAEAMTELSKAGLSVEDSIDAARGVLQLSAAASISAGEAAKLAATELNAFGLAGDQAERVTNLLAGASIQAQGEITDFAAAFQQASAQSKQAGLSIEQTTALLTQLARAGIRGSDAGTSLRVELLRLVPGTKPAQEAFEKLGIQIDRTMTIGAQLPSIIDQFSRSLAKLPTQDQTSVLRDIFGQDAGRAAIITLTDGAAAFAKVQAEVSKTGNASTLTEAKAKGLGGAVSGLGSTTENLSATIGRDLLPVLTALTHELTDIVSAADQVASAFNPVIDTLGSISGAVGGGDTVAHILLVVGAAAALNAQLQKRAATSALNAAAAAEEAAAQATVTVATEGEIVAQQKLAAAFAETAAVAVRSGRIEVASIAAATTAANGQTAALARSEAVLARRGLRGAFTTRGASGRGIAAGAAATVAGSFLPGTAGTIASAAGTGALLGSFAGPAGAVVGGLGFATIASIQAVNKRTETERNKVKAEFDKMTFVQQQAWLRSQGARRAAGLIAINGLQPKRNPFQGTFTFAPLLSAPAPTAETTARDDLNTAIASAGADSAFRTREFLQQFPIAGQVSPLGGIKTALSQRDVDNAKTIAALQKAVVDARGDTRALQAAQRALARERERQIREIIPSILTAIQPPSAALFGSRATVGPTARIALELSVAAVNKDEEATIDLLGERLTNQRLHVQALEAKVTLYKLSVADYNAAIKEITAANDKIAETQQALATELQNSATRFDPALAAADLAAINAQLSADSADDIAAAKAKAAASATRAAEVEKAQAGGLRNTPETIASAQQQAASDRVAVKTAQDQAREAAKQRAADAAKAAEEALQLQADELKAAAVAAGSRGRAEAKLIAFLRNQVRVAKAGTRARLEAKLALDDELDNQRAVLAASNKLTADLANARLDTEASRAALTTTTADDIAVDRLRIRAIDRQIRAAINLQKQAKKGSDEWKQAGIEIENLRQQKNGVLGDIQNLQGGPKGFTLTELFGAAAAQFQTFGSNIAGRSGVLSGQDERAAFAKDLLDTRGGNGNPLAAAHLTEAQKTNLILSQILDRLRITYGSEMNPSGQDASIAKKFPNASPAWRRAIFAQQSGYYT